MLAFDTGDELSDVWLPAPLMQFEDNAEASVRAAALLSVNEPEIVVGDGMTDAPLVKRRRIVPMMRLMEDDMRVCSSCKRA